MTEGARIVATYNSLVKDFGPKRRVVTEIHKSAKEASIDDPMVPVAGGPRHVEVLRNWSSKVLNDFHVKNNERVSRLTVGWHPAYKLWHLP